MVELEQTAPQPPALVRRLQERRATHRDRHPVIRAAFVVLGFAVLAGGVAMLVLPGPAFVVIPIGLATLSLEFQWAGRLLDRALVEADTARERARRTTRTQRILSTLAVAAAAVAATAFTVLYDVPVLPV